MAPTKPTLLIRSAAQSAEWLAKSAGAGPLAFLFSRDGSLVRASCIGEDGYIPPAEGSTDDGPSQVRPITGAQLAARIQFTYACEKDGSPVLFPLEAALRVCNAGDMMPRVRRLRGVIHVPLPRSDGTIIAAPGYDAASYLLYLPDAGLDVPSVPTRPTKRQTGEALKLIRSMVADFSFVSPHDEANYLGLLLTPLLRNLTPGPYKMGAIGAPQPGSGKTLLADCARVIHGGVFRSELPDNAEELRKTITTILDVTTGPIVHIDNVTGTMRSSVLAGLLTSPVWTDRRLGSNEEIRRENDRVWLITGNNLSLGGDLVRRTVQITIDPRCPNPEERTDFTIPHLESWVREHRGELVAALLTLVRSWVAAGRPLRRFAGAGSYQDWVQAVDGILGHAGLPGTFDHQDSRRVTVGEDDAEWLELLEAIHHEFGETPWTVRELLDKVAPPPNGPQDPEVQWIGLRGKTIPLDSLPAELGEKVIRGRMGAQVISKSLGRWLMNREGRYAGDRITVRRAGRVSNVQRWAVEPLVKDLVQPMLGSVRT